MEKLTANYYYQPASNDSDTAVYIRIAAVVWNTVYPIVDHSCDIIDEIALSELLNDDIPVSTSTATIGNKITGSVNITITALTTSSTTSTISDNFSPTGTNTHL